jgi:release factor glutamine methyltransferase
MTGGGAPPGADTAAVAARLRAAGCVFAEDEAQLLIEAAAGSADTLAAMVDSRAGGLPLEHVVGWAEFCGLRAAVDHGVFVPRRRTEFLVAQARALALTATSEAVILDLCCGCGAVGAALAAALEKAGRGRAELHAADIDPAAVACARRNVAAFGGQVYLGDLYQPLPPRLRGRVTILAANVPYVPAGEIGLLPAEARLHEPRVAVDGGQDGLEVARRVAADAPSWLAPGGHLLVETSERQAPRAAGDFSRAGLVSRIVSSDDAVGSGDTGDPDWEDLGATVVIGTRAG